VGRVVGRAGRLHRQDHLQRHLPADTGRAGDGRARGALPQRRASLRVSESAKLPSLAIRVPRPPSPRLLATATFRPRCRHAVPPLAISLLLLCSEFSLPFFLPFNHPLTLTQTPKYPPSDPQTLSTTHNPPNQVRSLSPPSPTATSLSSSVFSPFLPLSRPQLSIHMFPPPSRLAQPRRPLSLSRRR
jgi:hypothetical protein